MDLVKIRESKKYPGLFVKKYNRKVFYDNLWNLDTDLIESRGHVLDCHGKVVINPFTKIFNRFENNTDINVDEVCLWVRKINGFMACATYIPEYDDVIVSTTGSLDSEYVDMASKYINWTMKDKIKRHVQGATLIFEIVDILDPHIIKEIPGIYLLGMRFIDDKLSYMSSPTKEESLDKLANYLSLDNEVKVYRPTWGTARFGDIIQDSKSDTSEGVVVYGMDSGKVLKLKSKYYSTLKMMARKGDILSLNKKKVDEEYYSMVEFFSERSEWFNGLPEQDRLKMMKAYLESNYE
jgi:hypothetical protein